MSLQKGALKIAGSGHPVFPCRNTPDDPARHKSPHTRNGLKDATTDQKQILHWWNKWPHALIGMPTGKATGITVVDVDSGKATSDDPKKKAEGEAALKWWDEHKGEFKTATLVRTHSGGLHVYCRYTPGDRNTQGGIHLGVDRRGDGGYVIVPPSPGYTVERATTRKEWPPAAQNAEGKTTLDMPRYGMRDIEEMKPEGRDALAEALHCLLIEPHELHRNYQRVAFALAMYFDSPFNKTKAFLHAALHAARNAGLIDGELYRKHHVRLDRIAQWYAARRLEEIDEEFRQYLADTPREHRLKDFSKAFENLHPQDRKEALEWARKESGL